MKQDKDDLHPLNYCALESSTQTGLPVAIYARDPEKLRKAFETHTAEDDPDRLDFLKNVRVEKYDLDMAAKEGTTLGLWYKGEVERLGGKTPWKWAAEESNAWRTDLLLKKGGLYFDLDYFIVNPKKIHDLPLGTNMESWLHFQPNSTFMNAVANKWAHRWERKYDKDGPEHRVWGTMGPIFLTEVAAQLSMDNKVRKEGLHIFMGEETPNPMSLYMQLISRGGGRIHKPGAARPPEDTNTTSKLQGEDLKKYRQFQKLLWDVQPLYECDPEPAYAGAVEGLLFGENVLAYHAWANSLLDQGVCSRSLFGRLVSKACPTTFGGLGLSSGWITLD